jgi:hypothetical protein
MKYDKVAAMYDPMYDLYYRIMKRFKEREKALKQLKGRKFSTSQELENAISKQIVWNRIQKKIKKGLKSKNRDAKGLQGT